MSAPRVAILMLNYNGLALTQDCLRSLARVDYPAFRAMVLDNGSAVDETGPLRAEFGDAIDVVRSEDALGFCGGNNLLMRRAMAEGYDYLLLLNNDTTVEPDFLGVLVRLMESDRGIGASMPKILRYFDRTQIDSMGGDINLWTARHVHFRTPYTEVRTDLTFIHGCGFFLPRSTVERVGYLDEDYYIYWEEGDYGFRTRRAGLKLACDPRAVIYHKVNQTNVPLSNFYFYYMIRNAFLCMRKNGRWYQWPSFAVLFTIKTVGKYSVWLALKRPRDLPIVFEAIADFARGRLGRKDFARR